MGSRAAWQKGGQDADDYSKEVVRSDFEEAGDDDVYRKVRGDFDAAGVSISDSEIRSSMDKLLVTAVDQIREYLTPGPNLRLRSGPHYCGVRRNLCSAKLTPEQAMFNARRKEAYEEAKHPETVHGANQHTRTGQVAHSFAGDVATRSAVASFVKDRMRGHGALGGYANHYRRDQVG